MYHLAAPWDIKGERLIHLSTSKIIETGKNATGWKILRENLEICQGQLLGPAFSGPLLLMSYSVALPYGRYPVRVTRPHHLLPKMLKCASVCEHPPSSPLKAQALNGYLRAEDAHVAHPLDHVSIFDVCSHCAVWLILS
jgi:hypothetical protein